MESDDGTPDQKLGQLKSMWGDPGLEICSPVLDQQQLDWIDVGGHPVH